MRERGPDFIFFTNGSSWARPLSLVVQRGRYITRKGAAAGDWKGKRDQNPQAKITNPRYWQRKGHHRKAVFLEQREREREPWAPGRIKESGSPHCLPHRSGLAYREWVELWGPHPETSLVKINSLRAYSMPYQIAKVGSTVRLNIIVNRMFLTKYQILYRDHRASCFEDFLGFPL